MVKKSVIIVALVAGGLMILGQVHSGAVILPQVVSLGGLQLHVYGLVILTGLLVAILLAGKEMHKDKRLAVVDRYELLLWLILPGMLGARLYHVVTDWNIYADNWVQVLEVWRGGLGIPGAIIGGFMGMWFYSRTHMISLDGLLKAIVPVVPVAQAIGRLGNLVNQELYGPPTDLWWGMYVSPGNRILGYEEYAYFHPLYLYEALGNILLAFWLYRLSRKGMRGDRLLGVYILGYGILRYLLDFLRLDAYRISGLTYFQQAMLAVLVACLVMGTLFQSWYFHRYGRWFTARKSTTAQ